MAAVRPWLTCRVPIVPPKVSSELPAQRCEPLPPSHLPRAGSVGMLLLGWLQKQCDHPAQGDPTSVFSTAIGGSAAVAVAAQPPPASVFGAAADRKSPAGRSGKRLARSCTTARGPAANSTLVPPTRCMQIGRHAGSMGEWQTEEWHECREGRRGEVLLTSLPTRRSWVRVLPLSTFFPSGVSSTASLWMWMPTGRSQHQQGRGGGQAAGEGASSADSTTEHVVHN